MVFCLTSIVCRLGGTLSRPERSIFVLITLDTGFRCHLRTNVPRIIWDETRPKRSGQTRPVSDFNRPNLFNFTVFDRPTGGGGRPHRCPAPTPALPAQSGQDDRGFRSLLTSFYYSTQANSAPGNPADDTPLMTSWQVPAVPGQGFSQARSRGRNEKVAPAPYLREEQGPPMLWAGVF